MSGKQKGEKRKFRVTTRDMRMAMQIEGQNRQEEHDEDVKFRDEAMKNLANEKKKSGRGRKSRASVGSSGGSRRSSTMSADSNDAGSVDSRSSLGSITSEENSKALQSLQERVRLQDNVKDRLGKMMKKVETQKKNENTEPWSRFGVSRESVVDYEKYSSILIKVPNESDDKENEYQYVETTVESIESGQEHPLRNVKCYVCEKEMRTIENFTIVGPECKHMECLKGLFV